MQPGQRSHHLITNIKSITFFFHGKVNYNYSFLDIYHLTKFNSINIFIWIVQRWQMLSYNNTQCVRIEWFLLRNFPVEARSHCLEQNADLLSLSDSKVIQHMNSQLTRLSVYNWWIGMSNRDGTFLWTDGSPVNYINWHGSIIGTLNNIHYMKVVSLYGMLQMILSM